MVSPDPNEPEPLKYAMLGEDNSSVGDKLEKFTGIVDWRYLRPHWQSGVLYFVDPGLELADAGRAIAENRSDLVEGWLRSGDLVKIGDLHAAQWETGGQDFEALVVSPFVLCRPVQDSKSKAT